MSAVHKGLNWSARRAVAVLLGVMLPALLAGGAGGYLIRGSTTVVVTRSIPAEAVHQEAAPAMPARPLNADSQGGYRVIEVTTPGRPLNSDSQSGYAP
jgi:hypothetical protein